MTKMTKTDRWATVAGYSVYIDERGHVVRGVTHDGQAPLYPYRWNPRYNVWMMNRHMTPDALRAGIRRGTVKMK